MNKDYYQILGVSKDASQDEIKKSFRKLCMKWHPDRQSGKSDKEKEEAKQKFQEINEAYEVLGNEDKRREYDNPNPFGDMGGMNGFRDANGNVHFSWTSDGSDMGGFNPFDMFGQFFGGRRHVDPNAPRPGNDINLVLGIDLIESITGCTKKIRLNIEDNGKNGRELKTVTIEVKVPRGVPNGKRLRLGGQGNKGYNGGPSGDIYLSIAIKEHDTFVRQGYDIGCKVKVPFETFVLGGTIKIPTIDNGSISSMNYDVQPNSKQNKVVLFKGKGAPVMGSLNDYGDLKVLLELEMPDSLTNDELEALKKYRDLRTKNSK